jgi:hypothetical protein
MTIIFPSPIFGPVHSRRLGVSLGIRKTEKSARSTAFIVNAASMPTIVRRSICPLVKKCASPWKKS